MQPRVSKPAPRNERLPKRETWYERRARRTGQVDWFRAPGWF